METQSNWPRFLSFFSLKSIRYQIIIPYALVTLLFAGVGSFFAVYFVASPVERQFRSQLREAGAVISNEVVQQEELRLEIGRNIANTRGLQDELMAQNWGVIMTEIIAPLMTSKTGIDQILVVDTQGLERLRLYRDFDQNEAAFNSMVDTEVDLSAWGAVNRVLNDPTGKTKTVTVAQDAVQQRWVVYTITPLRTAEGVGGAVLVGHYLEEQLRQFKNISVTDVVLFSPDQQPLLSTLSLNDSDEVILAQQLTTERYFQVIARQEEAVLFDEVSLQAGVYRLAYVPFILQGQIQGLLAVLLSTDVVTQTQQNNVYVMSGIFMSILTAMLVVGFVVSSRITAPITHLVRVSKAITLGDLDRRAGLHGEDEVARLSENFDTMTDELQHKNATLQEHASQLQAILESMADGVLVQNREGEVISKNPATETILKNIRRSMRREAAAHRQRDPLPMLLRAINKLQPNEEQVLEIGQQILSAIATPFHSTEAQSIGTVVVLRDITREVESERLKDKFISSTSHELKTPLTAIKGYHAVLKMLLQQSALRLDKVVHERITDNYNKMERQINDLDNLVQSMLDLSQIDAQAFDLNPELMNLTELVEMTAHSWADSMAGKGLKFESNLPEEPLWVHGAPERLEQVLDHLLKNAYDYTLVGEVKISLTRQDEQHEVTVIIEDTGVGILSEDQPYLFTRFFRAIHEESTFAVAGAGLGLYLSRAIIDLHGGDIVVKSQPYKGTTVRFTLPTTAPHHQDN